jgi:hypothetical protein
MLLYNNWIIFSRNREYIFVLYLDSKHVVYFFFVTAIYLSELGGDLTTLILLILIPFDVEGFGS